jgi:hypothetical protein
MDAQLLAPGIERPEQVLIGAEIMECPVLFHEVNHGALSFFRQVLIARVGGGDLVTSRIMPDMEFSVKNFLSRDDRAL